MGFRHGKFRSSDLKLKFLIAVVLLPIAALSGRIPESKPNIIIILADDMGYGDCSVYNPASKIQTPHIDQLAKEGLLFTDAHSASGTCTPSRYGLLTGINPLRTGVLNTMLSRGDPIITKEEKTLAVMLRDQGYVTRMIGKWHLGFEEDKKRKRPELDFSKPLLGGPVDRGFDSFYGMHSSPGASPLCYIQNREAVALPTEPGVVEEGRSGSKPFKRKVMMSPGYDVAESSLLFCQEAVELIHSHAASKDANPLFLYYASPLPHKPWVPAEKFKGKSGLGPYGDIIMQLDDVVGQINTALKETGLDQNTMLFFASDNGPGPWAVKDMKALGHHSAGPLRGSKAYSWEGGHRVPFIVKWPGRTPKGTVTDAVINFTDLFATLADLQNADLQSYPESALDSVSFLSVLSHPSQNHKRSGMMFHRGAVREGVWKLVAKKRVKNIEAIKPSHFGLFHLEDDLSEKNDLSQAYPERAADLFKALKIYMGKRELK